MNRFLVISDIHGCLDQFNALLDKIDYKPRIDQLIILGDYVDRGPKSKEVVEKIIDMVKEDNVVALKGNHDQRFVELIKRNSSNFEEFIKYGGEQTLESYSPKYNKTDIDKVINKVRSEFIHHVEFLEDRPLYFETDYFIFVHAGLNPYFANWKEQPAQDFYSIRRSFIHNQTCVGKIVVFGHTRTIDIHNSPKIWFSTDKIGIDGGCASGLQLNCLEITEDNKYREYYIQANEI